MPNYTAASASSILTGTAGDDVFFVPLSAAPFTGTIDGLGGNDRIVFLSTDAAGASPTRGSLNLERATIRSVETFELASRAGQTLTVGFAPGQIADGTAFVGGAGIDHVRITASAGSQQIPALTFKNWTKIAGDIDASDTVTLQSFSPTGVSLASNDAANGAQVLIGSGSTPLIGSSLGETLVSLGSSSASISAGGGKDVVALAGPVAGQAAVFTGTIDGGAGKDTLVIGVEVAIPTGGHLVNFETIRFGETPGLFGATDHGRLTIGSDAIDDSVPITLTGTGALVVKVAPGDSYNAAHLRFASGALVSISIDGSAESDHIRGSSRADVIAGNAGDDRLFGQRGDDVINGGAGNDGLWGGLGNDRISGGAGVDVLRGNDGADTFLFVGGDSTEAARDRIMDFDAGEGDRIDLSAITAGHELHFGGSAFTHQAYELIQVARGDNMLVKLDIDGDGQADFSVGLFHQDGPLSADYILI